MKWSSSTTTAEGRPERNRYPEAMTLPAPAGDIDLAAARFRLGGRVHRTPLLHSRLLDDHVGTKVWLKAETFQKGGSFKARGAFNALLAALEAGDRRGVLAVSSGNHGQAVALAARSLNLSATVIMPEGSSPVKLTAVRGYGARVITDGVTGENREEVALQLSNRLGLRLVHPHNDPLVIAGQSTVGSEIVDQLRSLGVTPHKVLVPVGGGGLLAGVLLACNQLLPSIEVVGVEPATANDAQVSVAAGRLVSLDRTPETAADGARTLHLGQRCWEIIQPRVSTIVTVSEQEIAEACWWLWSRCKLVVEPTGAMTVAAARKLSLSHQGGPNRASANGGLVCILSGGNCSPDQISALLGQDPLSSVS